MDLIGRSVHLEPRTLVRYASIPRLKDQVRMPCRHLPQNVGNQLVERIAWSTGHNGVTAPQQDIWLPPGGDIEKRIDPDNKVNLRAFLINLLDLGNRVDGKRRAWA